MAKRATISIVLTASAIMLLIELARSAGAYPGGPQIQVTDIMPVCAGCHLMTKVAHTPEHRAHYSSAELRANEHYKALEFADKAYRLMPEDKRKALLKVVKWVDDNSSVTLKAPITAKPGAMIQLTVETKGGIGPVVGVALVDLPLRFQARPIASDGWHVADKPTVIGPDGKEQHWWLDKRANEKKNLSFILVQAKADVDQKVLPTVRITWSLRAPIDPATYTITAAFLYGTEEVDEYKSGKLEPSPGGSSGPSGRTAFSDTVTVIVQ
jgi:hypothetical protein